MELGRIPDRAVSVNHENLSSDLNVTYSLIEGIEKRVLALRDKASCVLAPEEPQVEKDVCFQPSPGASFARCQAQSCNNLLRKIESLLVDVTNRMQL